MHLRACLPSDHRLEIAHYPREWGRADHRADEVMRAAHARHPVAHGLAYRIFKGALPRLHRYHLGAEQRHAMHVGRLARHVLGPHVDAALHAHERGRRRRGHAVLPGPGLGDDAPLAHVARQQYLAQRVVQLVRAGMDQVLAFQVELEAQLRGEPSRVIDGGRPSA